MSQPRLLIFDDARGQWGPMTDRRPVFDLRTGAHTTRQRIERVLGRPADALHMPDRLAPVCRERAATADPNPTFTINQPLTAGDWLLVNGRWNATAHAQLITQLAPSHALIEADGGIVALRLPHTAANHWLTTTADTTTSTDHHLPDNITATTLPDRVLLARPWHVLDELPAALHADLAASTLPTLNPADHPNVHVIGDHPVHLGPAARLLPTVVLNAEAGPIVIDDHALINPFTMLQGPCYIGAHTTLAAHTAIRPHTVVGPHCKVGGEVSGAIIHSHSNKSHLGYLGNSLVGQWCNLGADTNVSNLKNTYGHVRIQLDPHTPPQDTGRMFHGPILGDFVRTAIGTQLLTGSVIHTGCMLALSSFAPKHAPPFGFYTDAGREPYDIDRLIDMTARMLARRGDTFTQTEADLLRHLHQQPNP
ncbi:putative sugar nucleotidyl transferase [Phycisphaerales bacterium AB-hyl4]|uniref:Sugar nucleotidyl transferase n=1 Tax=Natronomicrosphaera hydrolytica TaxID=3242702 RepID=A0ABV4U4C5_9BACT